MESSPWVQKVLRDDCKYGNAIHQRSMGHSIGISESYYKSTENEVLKDYLTAVNQLTISNESQIVQEEEIVELQKREYLIMSIFLIGITIH